MQHARAIRIALSALDEAIKRLAANANLRDQYNADAPACVAASERRAILREARETLAASIRPLEKTP